HLGYSRVPFAKTCHLFGAFVMSTKSRHTYWLALLAAVFAFDVGTCLAGEAHHGDTCHYGNTRRKVIIDQDAFGPAGSNMQAILMLLQAKDVEVLGITVPSGDGWRDEEVSQTLRLLEIAKRTEIPVYAGAVWPLIQTPALV